jgi:hypothetical protein
MNDHKVGFAHAEIGGAHPEGGRGRAVCQCRLFPEFPGKGSYLFLIAAVGGCVWVMAAARDEDEKEKINAYNFQEHVRPFRERKLHRKKE